jgi:alkanesulfonate monooxygenase SsuD/methylene tetrahydromethanopterin reductase-like flavin-dependent oxidoreductase (luciferase family)
MKFSNFLFTESRTPETDQARIAEALAEAELSEALGFEVIWLAEHHFDGICAYVDPIAFCGAVAARTSRITIGFAVAQMALHHPIRLAEQIALLDNLSNGRIIFGVGRGTAFNIYEYDGYGVDPEEAQARLLEAEEVIVNAWTTPGFEHRGRFWNLRVPALRPPPVQRPHPPIIRACSGEESTLEMARAGRPFMMNVQSNETTRKRMNLYRQAMAEAGYDEAAIAANVENTWIWRNIVVAETDAEAEAVGRPAFAAMTEFRAALRNRVKAETGRTIARESAPDDRTKAEHSLICGSPATVCEKLAEIDQIGVGGLILQFRLGPMPQAVAEQSLRLFAQEVAPQFRAAANG